jgi:predicted deacylase
MTVTLRVPVLLFLLALTSCTWPRHDDHENELAAGGFSSSYDDARDRFRGACARVIANERGFCRNYRINSSTDPDLTIDYAYVTRMNHRLLILQSGLHGVEGFAGAAVEQVVLEQLQSKLLDAGWDLLVIHAANPYGFRYLRRVDEYNVDLNRNFSLDGKLYGTPSTAYASLRVIAEPPGPVIDADSASTGLATRTLLAFAKSGFNFSYVSNGLHAGQYSFPQGFEYGGSKPEQQSQFLLSVVRGLMETHDGTVLFFDLHTGLGPSGALSVIAGMNWMDGQSSAVADWIAGARRPDIIFTPSTKSAFQTSGDVIDFVPGLGPKGRVIAVTLEYGTVGNTIAADIRTNSRMILENQAHWHGCQYEATCKVVKDRFVDLFNPADPGWQQGVLEKGAWVLNSLVDPSVQALLASATRQSTTSAP